MAISDSFPVMKVLSKDRSGHPLMRFGVLLTREAGTQHRFPSASRMRRMPACAGRRARRGGGRGGGVGVDVIC